MSLFGASTPPSFSFGAASTPAFGAASSSTFSFGVASTPAFGQSSGGLFGAVSTPAFGAASAPAFGGFGASTSAPAFGAASTPAFGVFGATGSTPSFGFGAAASTPAFGAGTPGSPFGAPSSSSFSFGASTPAFGAPSSSSSFSFGAASPFGAPSSSSFSFGAAPAPSLFGAPQPQPQQALQQGLPPQPDLGPIRELAALREAFSNQAPPGASPRFSTLFLNVVDSPAARQRPPGVDSLAWREALQRAGGPDNPQRLWPVPARGFPDLLARLKAQDAATEEHRQRLAAALAAAEQLALAQKSSLQERLEDVKRAHQVLCTLLLRACRHVDVLEGRFASAFGLHSARHDTRAGALRRQLAALEAALAPGSSGGLEAKAGSLASAARMRLGPLGAAGAGGSRRGETLDPASLKQVFAVLQGHAQALAKLQSVVKRADIDLSVLAEERERGQSNGLS